MPYLQLDLEAKKAVPSLSRALGIEVHAAGWGLLELWEWCWNNKQTEVSGLLLRGFFGCPAADLGEVLAAFGFLEAVGDGKFRVRGADKYLRISEARAEAGKKRIATASRSPSGRVIKAKCPAIAGDPTSTQPASHQQTTSSYTKHRSPNTQLQKKPSAPAAPDGEYDDLVRQLFDAFKAKRGEDHLPTGRDWAALKRLRGLRTPAEILSKWVAGLAASYGARMNNFSDLETRWNNVEGALPPPDRPKCAQEGCQRPSDADFWGVRYCYPHLALADQQQQEVAG